MGKWPHRAVLSTLVVVCGIGIGQSGAVIGQADVGAVMLHELGSGFEMTDESVDPSGALARTFTGPSGALQILGFAVPEPRLMFGGSLEFEGFDFVDEPSLGSRAGSFPTGSGSATHAFSALAFATREHFFTIRLDLADGATIDGPAFVLDLARRQREVAGMPPPAPDEAPDAADEKLSSLMPEAPPERYALNAGSLTLPGFSPTEDTGLGDELTGFLNKHAAAFAEVWGRGDLAVAVGVTKYPSRSSPRPISRSSEASIGSPCLPDSRQLHPTQSSSEPTTPIRWGWRFAVGTPWHSCCRRTSARHRVDGHRARRRDGSTRRTAPAGWRYDALQVPDAALPPGRSGVDGRLRGVGGGGSQDGRPAAGARVRKRWAADPIPVVWPEPRRGAAVVPLDADAALLRRRGAVVMAVQLLTITVGVVALSATLRGRASSWPLARWCSGSPSRVGGCRRNIGCSDRRHRRGPSGCHVQRARSWASSPSPCSASASPTS